jgi:hypothetical protein
MTTDNTTSLHDSSLAVRELNELLALAEKVSVEVERLEARSLGATMLAFVGCLGAAGGIFLIYYADRVLASLIWLALGAVIAGVSLGWTFLSLLVVTRKTRRKLSSERYVLNDLIVMSSDLMDHVEDVSVIERALLKTKLRRLELSARSTSDGARQVYWPAEAVRATARR